MALRLTFKIPAMASNYLGLYDIKLVSPPITAKEESLDKIGKSYILCS